MPAPVGNDFWKRRSKHGRDALFASPELLWDAACDYFQWCIDNPYLKNDFRGKDADEVILKLERPFTLSGLMVHLEASQGFWKEFKKTQTGTREDFLPIITRIEEIIETQQLEGAMVGIFHNNIVARKLGLTEKVQEEGSKEVTIKVRYERKDNNAQSTS